MRTSASRSALGSSIVYHIVCFVHRHYIVCVCVCVCVFVCVCLFVFVYLCLFVKCLRTYDEIMTNDFGYLSEFDVKMQQYLEN